MAPTHPPAWYRDPDTPQLLRRWDGRAWTDDVRPLPPWMHDLRAAPGPRPSRPLARRARIQRRLWTASSITLAFALLLLLSLVGSFRVGPSSVGNERVGDEHFLVAASEACERANRTVFAPYRESSTRDPESLATAVEAFVDDLRDIEVRPSDRARVDRWLAAWDSWTEAGHEYADALERGDDARAEEITEDSHLARTTISRFAYANGLGACVL